MKEHASLHVDIARHPLRLPFMALSAVGVVLVTVGALVMLGWYTHTAGLVQVFPAFTPMQPNTALCFVFAGAGLLLCVARGGSRITLLLGLVVGTVGVLTTAEHLFRFDLGIDQLLVNQFTTVGTTQPGRMAPNSALCFALVGIAFSVVGSKHKSRYIPSILALLGSLVLALGTVAFSVYLAGMSSASGWADLTRMAVHTAFGMALLGTGIIVVAWTETPRTRAGAPRWLPLPVGIGTAAIALLIWKSLDTEYLAHGLSAQRPLLLVTLFGGLLLAVLLSLAVYMVQASSSHAREMEASNRDLQNEVAEHKRTQAERDRLFDMSVDMIAIARFDGYFIRANPAFEKTLGYDQAEYLSRPFLDFVCPEDREETITQMSRLLLGETVLGFQNRYVCKDGSEKWLDWACVPVVEEGLIYAVARDITEQKKAEEALRESEERYRTVYNALHEGIVLQHADGTIQAANASAERILGLSADQMMGRTSLDPMWRSIHEDGSPFPGETHPIVVSLATGQPQRNVVLGVYKPDRSLAWLSVNCQPLFRHGETTPYAAVASIIDITEIRLLEQSIRVSEERYHSLFEHSLDAILLTMPDGRILAANPAATSMFKLREEELLRLGRAGVVDTADPRLDALIEERTRTGKAKGEITMKRGDGSLFPAEISSAIYHDSTGRAHTSMFVRDITESKKIAEQLTYQAFYDPLTQLPNRALFMDRLERQVQQVKRNKNHLFAVLFLDLDRFKFINDSLGHAAGDRLLTEIAGRLKTCVRANDTVARLGGDEFTILLDGVDQMKSATMVADRIQDLLKQPFDLSGHEVFITASLGIAISTSGYNSSEDLLRDADTAMYRAKTSGKARYIIFDREMHAGAMQTLQLETDLRRAIDREEFIVHYQPIIDMAGGKVAGFEALVRWRRGPEGSMVPPGDFLPLAEETGLLISIDWWVLKESCRKLKEEHARSRTKSRPWVSVNFSARQFASVGLVERIKSILRDTGLQAKYLRLEITESALIENITSLQAVFSQLRRLGVQLYLDDFGTGYSSLSYLHRFPVNALKIDRSFISRLTEPGGSSEIVRATITLAHGLGMPVVAEGVETAAQLDMLSLLCCDYAQGYYFAKPAPDMGLEVILAEAVAV
ncbi:MAG: EAL domain-containing protein [Chloroflexota bacterium]|nr:EAL domain-containing protein [Chloroflexota bacterium]